MDSQHSQQDELRSEASENLPSEAIQETDEYLRLALEAADMGWWRWDLATDQLTGDARCDRLFWLPPGTELSIQQFLDLVHPDDRCRVKDDLARTLSVSGVSQSEFRVVGPDGSLRWILAKGSAMAGTEGKPVRLVGVVVEVTAQKQADELLRASEEKFRTIAEFNYNWEEWRGPSGELLYISPSCEKITGFRAEDFVANPGLCLALTHPDDREMVESHLRASSHDDRGCCHLEFRILARGGEVRWIAHDCQPVFGKEGAWLGRRCSNRDITQQKRTEEALRESEQRYRGLFENQHTVMLLIDPETAQIVDANPAACAFYGWTREEMRARKISDINTLPPDQVRQRIEQAQRKDSVVFQFQHRLASGDIRDVEVHSSPVPLDRKTLLYSIILDVTERNRFEGELAKAKQGAEAANEAKGQFLANVSHELRTPMSAILGMTDLALAENLSPQVRDFLQTASDSAEMLLALLNEILDFARVESGKFALETAPFRLRDVLQESLRTLSIRAHDKGLAISCNVDPDVPDCLAGDAFRLRQILLNLVGNAVKFTEHGRVAIRAGLESRSESSVYLRFAVEDSGIGIAPEDQQLIFAPFAQADASTTRRFGGTGLGLAITSSLIGLMGGRIWVESEVGMGSTFYFTLCFTLSEDSAEKHGTKPHPAASLAPLDRPLRILLAEDTPANQKLIQFILQKRGHSVAIAPNGQEAVELFRREDFDLVLMDVQMPVMDGFQATAAIRALRKPGKALPPIVAMTAHAMKGDEDRCLASGMDAYLAKPIDRGQLIRLIETLVAESRRRAQDSTVGETA